MTAAEARREEQRERDAMTPEEREHERALLALSRQRARERAHSGLGWLSAADLMSIPG
jgi:ribosomal protein S14